MLDHYFGVSAPIDPASLQSKFVKILMNNGTPMPETAIEQLFSDLLTPREDDAARFPFPLLCTVHTAKRHAKRMKKAFGVLRLTL